MNAFLKAKGSNEAVGAAVIVTVIEELLVSNLPAT